MTTVFWSASVMNYVGNMTNRFPEKAELNVICGVVCLQEISVLLLLTFFVPTQYFVLEKASFWNHALYFKRTLLWISASDMDLGE